MTGVRIYTSKEDMNGTAETDRRYTHSFSEFFI